jgi:hypothetical protein
VAGPPRLTVEHVDVINCVSRDYSSVLVDPLVDPLLLQGSTGRAGSTVSAQLVLQKPRVESFH